jgi:hypothetical protein
MARCWAVRRLAEQRRVAAAKARGLGMNSIVGEH